MGVGVGTGTAVGVDVGVPVSDTGVYVAMGDRMGVSEIGLPPLHPTTSNKIVVGSRSRDMDLIFISERIVCT
jgi:hypothetical protein